MRARVFKAGGVWQWNCCPPCPAGGNNYRTQAGARVALDQHRDRHRQFGFQKGKA